MERVNLFRVLAEFDESDPEGYGAARARFGPSIGAALLGGTVYELSPGTSICPYAEDRLMVRRESGVGYWDREVPVVESPER